MSNSGENERDTNGKRGREEEEDGREKRRKVHGFAPSHGDSTEKDKSGGVDTSRVPSLVSVGDRQRFTVELRPGETTIVSWRKLVKDSNKLNGSTSKPEPPPSNSHPVIHPCIAPGQDPEKELKDEPPPNRFSAVIEKIERLYMGKDSSDDEDLNDLPDDNQYDTEDSFIDDAELDEYFEVDNSSIKHDGFFVNRGKLERINETTLPNQQVKKRRAKYKSHPESDIHAPNKQSKLAKKTAGRSVESAPVAGKFPSNLSHQRLALKSGQIDDFKFPSQSHTLASTKKKPTDIRTALDPPQSSKILNGDASASTKEAKDIERKKVGVLQYKAFSNKSKDAKTFFDDSRQKYRDRSSHTHVKSQAVKQPSSADGEGLGVRAKEKKFVRELPDLNIPEVKDTEQTVKVQHSHRREGSSSRPKSSMLERAIKELERTVTESRPPNLEVQDGDASSQGVKRRLPYEIKQKLAKVARLAQLTQGKISKELTNRLMSILGHLVQLRTLKRNLKIMVNMSLSAKQEKDNRFQQIKKEVVDMIKMELPSLNSRVSEQLPGTSDDFQEAAPEGKTALKISMSNEMEDKICDLYDLYLDGLDEDAAPQMKKLYAELAKMWPDGFMDNHGIKRAICRAKARRKALYSQRADAEKYERKKVLPRAEEGGRVESGSVCQPQHARERLANTEPSGGGGVASPNRPTASTSTTVAPGIQMQSPLRSSGHGLERPKCSSGTSAALDGMGMKKKVKRKPEVEMGGDPHSRLQPL